MSLVLNGAKYSKITLTGDRALETYDANITPENMQYGMTAYVKGKKVVGTGKAFAVAGYGVGKVQSLLDENGNKKYGLSIFARNAPNIIFIAPTTIGDIVLQTTHVVDLTNDTVNSIGINHTASGEICVFHNKNRLTIYLNNIESEETELNYFYGKDNER